ncbi:MAG: hypothetical protein ACTSP5_12040, partial [Candidatus Heimdallarchaeota archaeon]
MSYKKITIFVLILFVTTSFISINRIESLDEDKQNVVENDSFAVSSEPPITGGTFAAQEIDADNISSLYSWDENYGNPYCVYYADNRAYLGTDDALV